ncbi:MAG: tetratricopeptide repeat protein, partial [Myxococcota bacterium]|nr:tetratricopeptide repeat protein [Myxococcota bacterium]
GNRVQLYPLQMDRSEPHYMLRGADGVRHGPMPRYRVVELIERGFFGAEDHVEREGEGMAPLGTHPDFAGFFIVGDSRHEQLDKARKERGLRNKRYRRIKRWRSLFRITALSGGLLGVGLAAVEYRRWLPEPAQEWVSERLLGAAGLEPRSEPIEEKPRVLDGLLSELGERYAELKGEAVSFYDQGVRILVSSPIQQRSAAVEEMEKAVLLSRGEPWAVGGLVAALSHSSESLHARRSDAYLAHLRTAEGGSVSLNLGLGFGALVRGDPAEAAARASTCVEDENYRALCHWVLISALGQTGQYEKLGGLLPGGLERFPESPEVLLWMGDFLRSQGNYAAAEGYLQSAGESLQSEMEYHRARADFDIEVGDFDAAMARLQSVLELDAEDRQAAYRLGTLFLQHRSDPEAAIATLRPCAKMEDDGFGADPRAYLQASHAHRVLGDTRQALLYAEKAIEREPTGAPFHLAKAMALEAQGDGLGAERVWDSLDLSGIEGPELARMHAWAARFYLKTGRLRMARDQVQQGLLADPNLPVLGLLTAVIRLRLGDYAGLESALTEALLSDLKADRSRVPMVSVWGVSVDAQEIAASLKTALQNDPRWSRELPSFLSAVRILNCFQTGRCSAMEQGVQEALRAKPESLLARLGQLQVAIEQENWQEALLALSEIGGPNRRHAVVLGLEGAALTGLGRHREAVVVLEEAFRGGGADSSLSGRWLVRAHTDMGNHDKANAVERRIRSRDPNVFVTGAILRKRSLDSSK